VTPALAALLSLAALGADLPAPATPADLAGARSLAIGATLAMPGGNDGMFVNAAALAARRRYAVETQFVQERVGSTRAWQAAQVSVVDSETAAFTGGLAYTRVSQGTYTGNLFHLAAAGALGGGVLAGVTAKYLDLSSGTGTGSGIGVTTVDLSLYYQPVPLVAVGVAGYNLIPVGHVGQVPRAFGMGFAVGDDQRVRLAADWRRDLQRAGKPTDLWAFGAEALVLEMFPVRAGYVRDGTRGGTSWSVGSGLVSSQGLALDLSYRQSITAPDDRTFAAALKIFIPAH
jgi:hypothetical protein